jgi:hypothetical protein
MGGGQYRITYMVFKTGTYAMQIADDTSELRRLTEKDPETLSTLGYSTWSYGDAFTIIVFASSTSAKFSSVMGDGLRGGVKVGRCRLTLSNPR